ncbi:uncharacterized protein VICG_01640 [Vittaforma corneae ATCC 50505]|uniref:Uncharacterized protein n=1 Tax=Vittaforma corneae (strain ATCC 50505) TaxID=993615 RepID=L2GLU9_VITCO|nr:uncharacterized protein VICG_01640 [Vittaforma corneae ATCC 50505]ELA41267.1 hypothetical protein VICG_01640 [Vittaforma corneae ATCC 50505]
MEESAILQLNGTFDFAGELSSKLVSFFKNQIEIGNENFSTTLKYTEVAKISYNSRTVKILMKNGSKIKIPCCSSDIKRIKTILRARKDDNIIEVGGSALVRLSDLCFVVPIRSNDIRVLKTSIIRRISEHFYPACEAVSISTDIFNNISICCESEKGSEIQLVSCEDLEAALSYFDGKLKLIIKQ